MAPHISVHTASGTVPAMVCRASPLTLRIRTRFRSLEYRNIFSATRSRNTTGMVSSPPVMARVWPFMERSWPRNSFTSGWEIIDSRVWWGRASKARWDMGSLRILISVMLVVILSSWILFSLRSGAGLLASKEARSFSRPSISRARSAFASSWACFSASYFSTSSLTACSSSAVWASWMACSSSASRVANVSSLARSSSSSFLFFSMER